MDLSAIALQGLQQAQVQLEQAAVRIARAGDTSSVDGAPLDVVDLSAEVVALMSASNDYAVNLTTMKTADQIQKTTIDMFA